MAKTNTLQHEDHHIAASFKAVVLVTVIGIVASVVSLGAPGSTAAPDEPAMMADVSPSTDGSPPAPPLGEQPSPAAHFQGASDAPTVASR
jgi:hypothetical protein